MHTQFIIYFFLFALLVLPDSIGAELAPKKKCKGKGTKSPTSKGTKSPTSKGTKSPTSKGTKSPTSKGKKVPKCDDGSPSAAPSLSPSASPSISSSPTLRPTLMHSTNPTSNPSPFPSTSPSISHEPSISFSPSFSGSPSLQPSRGFSSWCETYNSNSTPPIDGEQTNGTYFYEMVYKTDEDLQTILNNLDNAIKDLLFGQFVRCPKANNTRYLNSDLEEYVVVGVGVKSRFKNTLRSLLIDSFDLNGVDSEHSDTCSELSTSDGQSCKTFEGSFTLYVRDDMNLAKARIDTLRFLKNQMDNGTLATKVDDVYALRFTDEVVEEFANPEAMRGVEPVAAASLSLAGMLMIATGSIVTLLFIFAATRRREHYKVERMEEVLEEEESLFGKGIGLDDMDNETDLMSTGSWKKSRKVRILGDDDSVNGVQLYGLHGSRSRSFRGGNGLGSRDDDAINVHKCTSATCPICSPQNLVDPTFIKSIYPDNENISNSNARCYSAPNTINM